MKTTALWDVAPCSLVEIYRHFRGACCIHHQGDKSQNYQTTRRNITGDSHLLTRLRKNLKSYHVHKRQFPVKVLILVGELLGTYLNL
jgi:hypothetical protein